MQEPPFGQKALEETVAVLADENFRHPQALERDGFLEAEMVGAVDDSEAAFADDGIDPVLAFDRGADPAERIRVLDFAHEPDVPVLARRSSVPESGSAGTAAIVSGGIAAECMASTRRRRCYAAARANETRRRRAVVLRYDAGVLDALRAAARTTAFGHYGWRTNRVHARRQKIQPRFLRWRARRRRRCPSGPP